VRLTFRVVVTTVRPPVLLLLSLFAAAGLAEGGGHRSSTLARPLLTVVAFLLFSVTVNDLADQEIDRVNLSGDKRRLLVTGACGRTEFIALAVSGGLVAIASSALINPSALAVTVAGLAVSAAYSLRPVRVADRGVLAPMLLPAAYVAVPYLLGLFTVRPSLTRRDEVLLVGLYLGFVGRIVLKDFRDVKGDALFGKRTLLIRHGRAATCRCSGLCWAAGSLVIAFSGDVGLRFVVAAFTVLAMILLHALSTEGGSRRDDSLISALAILGRGTIVALLADLSMRNAHWSAASATYAIVAFAATIVGQTLTMARHGPSTGLTVPAGWSTLRERPEMAEASAQSPAWSSSLPVRRCDAS
jgi:4-hydroxybenzoate polyprenyltransferase